MLRYPTASDRFPQRWRASHPRIATQLRQIALGKAHRSPATSQRARAPMLAPLQLFEFLSELAQFTRYNFRATRNPGRQVVVVKEAGHHCVKGRSVQLRPLR